MIKPLATTRIPPTALRAARRGSSPMECLRRATASDSDRGVRRRFPPELRQSGRALLLSTQTGEEPPARLGRRDPSARLLKIFEGIHEHPMRAFCYVDADVHFGGEMRIHRISGEARFGESVGRGHARVPDRRHAAKYCIRNPASLDGSGRSLAAWPAPAPRCSRPAHR